MPRDNIPAIPPPPRGISDVHTQRYLEALHSALTVRLGQTRNNLDRSPTLRELIDGGIVTTQGYTANGIPTGSIQRPGVDPGDIDTPFSDLSVPEAPQNLQVASTPFTNRLTWDFPQGFTANITSFAEVWAHDSDDRASALLIGIGNNSFVHAVEPMSTTYYWVRFISFAGIEGPYNAVSGVAATTPQDPASLVELLEDAIDESSLTDALNRRVLARTAAYIESFEDNDIDRITGTWTEIFDTGSSLSIVSSSGPGNFALNVGDNAGSDDAFYRGVDRKLAMPVTDGGLYRIKAAYRRVAGTSPIQIGVLGFKGDVYSGNGAMVNQLGADSFSDPFFFGTQDLGSGTTLQTIEGYFTTGAAYALNAGTLDDPHVLHPDVDYVSPFFRQSGVNGQSELAYISIEQMPGGLEVSQSLNKYVVKVDSNGYVSGFGLLVDDNDGTPVSQFQVAVDQFVIRSPGSTDLAFAVDDGRVVMNGASIQDATIGNAQISDLSADRINAGSLDASYITIDGITLSNSGGTLKIETAGVGTDQIANLAITNAKIGNAAITGAKIGTAEIDTLLIAGDAVTVPAGATSSTLTGDGTWYIGASVTVTLDVTSDVLVSWSVSNYHDGSSPTWGYQLRRLETGEPDAQLVIRSSMNMQDEGAGARIDSAVPAGTYTYDIRWIGTATSPDFVNATTVISVVGIQR